MMVTKSLTGRGLGTLLWGGRDDFGVGRAGGLGSRLVGLDLDVETSGVSDVPHDTVDAVSVSVAVRSSLDVVFISGLFLGHVGSKLVGVVVLEAVGLGWLRREEKATGRPS